MSRGGLPAEWGVTVTRLDGGPLVGPLIVSHELDYYRTFEQHAVDPTPAASWTSDGRLYWELDVPDGVRRFTVSFDGRVQPNANWRRTGDLTVEIDGEQLTVEYTTWLFP